MWSALVLAVAVASQTGDDLGSVPLQPPTPADLGVDNATPTPTPSTPTPSTPKRPRPAPAVPLPTPASLEEAKAQALQLRAEMEQALQAEPADKKTIDSLAGAALPEALRAAEPAVKSLQKLVKARGLLLDKRLDEVAAALREARAAADALEGVQQRRLIAAARYLEVEVEETRVRPTILAEGCAGSLGLRRLASDEGQRRRKALESLSARWRAVATGRDRFWGRRAAFRVTAIYEDFFRSATKERFYRASPLLPPLSVDVASAALAQPTLDGWAAELKRTYHGIIGAIDARDPDAILADLARARASQLNDVPKLPDEPVENPWLKDLHDGVVRYARGRAERRNGGRWAPMEARLGVAAMEAAVKTPVGSVDHAYSLVGLAEAQPEKVSTEMVQAALLHSDARVRVAGLLAVEKVVVGKAGAEKAATLREPVILALLAVPPAEQSKAFTTLQGSLFGVFERGLLALRAVIAADRAAAAPLLDDARLAMAERAWLVAELADASVGPKLQQWANDRDPRVAALAIWGAWLAQGSKVQHLARASADGVVGCVSRAILAKQQPR